MIARRTTGRRSLVLVSCAVLAAAAVVAISALLSGGVTGRSSQAPLNTVSPTIIGYATPRSELYATSGTWARGQFAYGYQWEDCNASGAKCRDAIGPPSGSCSPTANCYVVTSAEARAGEMIKVAVTAKDSHGATRTVVASYRHLASPSEPVPCALNHAAGSDGTNSCWALHTGVVGATGFTEADIVAGKSTLTHIVGDLTITKPNTVLDRVWVSGCIAIEPGANNVTIRDSLITPHSHTCSGGDGGSQASAVNDGQSSRSPAGLLIEDTTVDGGNVGDYGVSIIHGSCIRCNISGFADNFWSGSNGAVGPSLFEDSYSHDMATGSAVAGDHEQALMLAGADHVAIIHSYAIASAGDGHVTGALNLQGWGAAGPAYVTADINYLEGVSGVDLIGGCTSTYTTVTHNAFSNDNGYGGKDYVSYFETSAHRASNVGTTWAGNYVAESRSQPAPPPGGDPGTDGC